MAQMRVKDQDLVIDQIKSKVNEQGLEAFKNRKDKGITNQLDARIVRLKTYKLKKVSLKIKYPQLKKSMTEVVDEFQKEFIDEDNAYSYGCYFRGINFESNSYSNGIPTYSLNGI